MPHIHTDPGQHDFTVSAYIVRLDTLEPSLMLHMHKKLGKYLQFGGHVELTENPWQALTHELAEESGYNMEQLQLLQPPLRLTKFSDDVITHPLPFNLMTHRFGDLDHYHTSIDFAFTAHEEPWHPVASGESTAIKTFTAQELAKLTDDEIPANVRETGLFLLEHFKEFESIKPLDYY